MTSGGETLLTSVSSTAQSYIDSTAVAGTTYYYQVAAVNSVGPSLMSTEVNAAIGQA